MVQWAEQQIASCVALHSSCRLVLYENEYILSTERFIIDSVPQLKMDRTIGIVESQLLGYDNNEVGGNHTS
jgi:hypothetical protein